MPVWPDSEADLFALPPALFEALERNIGTVHALNVSAAGREVRLRDNEARQVAFRKSLRGISEGLSADHRAYLEAVVHLLFTTSAFQIMKDHWGLVGRDAGQASAWAIKALLKAAREEGRQRNAKPVVRLRTGRDSEPSSR